MSFSISKVMKNVVGTDGRQLYDEFNNVLKDRYNTLAPKNNDIGSMEFLSCIPGSIGGAIIMNSGCYGADISEILLFFIKV